ncbi:MAG: hypothetical protein QOF51_428 [Chloroflexota bacterium]|nr:hypothetical protein [Chloroflexota bacterium]
MTSENEAASQRRDRLLREQLRPGETLDGVFVADDDTSVAVTSERLLIMRPSKPNGWEMKAIPWRLMTSVTLEPPENKRSGLTIVRLVYALPGKTGGRGGAPLQRAPWLATEPAAPADPPGELTLSLPTDAKRMAKLLNARIPVAPVAPPAPVESAAPTEPATPSA